MIKVMNFKILGRRYHVIAIDQLEAKYNKSTSRNATYICDRKMIRPLTKNSDVLSKSTLKIKKAPVINKLKASR